MASAPQGWASALPQPSKTGISQQMASPRPGEHCPEGDIHVEWQSKALIQTHTHTHSVLWDPRLGVGEVRTERRRSG